MSRIKPIFTLSDCPAEADEETRSGIEALFGQLFPGKDDPEIDTGHTGLALAAHNPTFAANLSKLTTGVVLQMGWTKRQDLMELAIQAVNLHFKSAFSFETRLAKADASGAGADRIAALPYWKTSGLFDDEQRLVLAYTNSVVTGDVPKDLFDRVKAKYGEKGTVEFTALIGTFSLWAMLINAML